MFQMPTGGLEAVAHLASIFSYLPEIQITDVIIESSSVMPQKPLVTLLQRNYFLSPLVRVERVKGIKQ